MFVAFCDQLLGNSTSRCSNATRSPWPMRASRISHSTASNGCVSAVREQASDRQRRRRASSPGWSWGAWLGSSAFLLCAVPASRDAYSELLSGPSIVPLGSDGKGTTAPIILEGPSRRPRSPQRPRNLSARGGPSREFGPRGRARGSRPRPSRGAARAASAARTPAGARAPSRCTAQHAAPRRATPPAIASRARLRRRGVAASASRGAERRSVRRASCRARCRRRSWRAVAVRGGHVVAERSRGRRIARAVVGCTLADAGIGKRCEAGVERRARPSACEC